MDDGDEKSHGSGLGNLFSRPHHGALRDTGL